MYLTLAQRRQAVIDPTVHDREREDFNQHQRKARLIERLDRAASRVARLEQREASGDYVRPGAMGLARHNLEFYTAAAERAGLIRPRKEPAK